MIDKNQKEGSLMYSWKRFLDSWATDGGQLMMLFIVHNILIVLMICGYSAVLKESYFLVLGALLGVLKGEVKNHKTDDTK